MNVVAALELISLAIRVASEASIDIVEFKAALDKDGNLPQEKRKEYLARAEAAVAKL